MREIMLTRLRHVFEWIAYAIILMLVAVGVYFYFTPVGAFSSGDGSIVALAMLAHAVVLYLIVRAVRFVVAGY
jgi:uncharacterized membrane protein YczE